MFSLVRAFLAYRSPNAHSSKIKNVPPPPPSPYELESLITYNVSPEVKKEWLQAEVEKTAQALGTTPDDLRVADAMETHAIENLWGYANGLTEYFLRYALKIREKKLPLSHPHVGRSYFQLSNLFSTIKDPTLGLVMMNYDEKAIQGLDPNGHEAPWSYLRLAQMKYGNNIPKKAEFLGKAIDGFIRHNGYPTEATWQQQNNPEPMSLTPSYTPEILLHVLTLVEKTLKYPKAHTPEQAKFRQTQLNYVRALQQKVEYRALLAKLAATQPQQADTTNSLATQLDEKFKVLDTIIAESTKILKISKA